MLLDRLLSHSPVVIGGAESFDVMQVGDRDYVFAQQLGNNHVPHGGSPRAEPLGRVYLGDLGKLGLGGVQRTLARVSSQCFLGRWLGFATTAGDRGGASHRATPEFLISRV
ncbi:hypothetical protein D3C73_1349830 [compost metagenome]